MMCCVNTLFGRFVDTDVAQRYEDIWRGQNTTRQNQLVPRGTGTSNTTQQSAQHSWWAILIHVSV